MQPTQPKMMTLVEPICSCCDRPTPLTPRDDLPGGLAACPTTGQLYRPEGTRYTPSDMPPITTEPPHAPSVQIDLSRSSYA
jgi:hypothetical protein